jgi:hypothetical protein
MQSGLSAYDANAVLAALDANKTLVNYCLLFALPFTFIYFLTGVRLAIRQQVYTVPFLACAFFVWHDGGYVLIFQHWSEAYQHHWWLARWEYPLVGTVALEAFLIWQFIKYGREELLPETTPAQFGALAVLCTLGLGAFWWLLKVTLADELAIVSFVITAAFPAIPFHTGMILRRKSRVGQSIWMQVSVLLVHLSMSAIGMIVAPAFFRAPPYITYCVTMSLWALLNVWLISRYPKLTDQEARARLPHGAAASGVVQPTP